MVQTRKKRLVSGIEVDSIDTVISEVAHLAKRRKLVPGAVSHNNRVLGPTGKNALSILLQKDNLYPVHQSLTAHLEIMDIIRLTRTCKALSKVYQDLRSSNWDLDSYLSRWFNNPALVRLKAAQHGAVIGGTAIFDFMARRDRDDAVVEVYMGGYCRDREEGSNPGSGHRWGYVSHPKQDEAVFIQLLKGEGYSIVAESSPGIHIATDMNMHGWRRVISLTKRTRNRILRVQFICSGDEDGLSWIISNIRSTACLNLLFWDRCVSIFPNATFNKKVAFIMGSAISYYYMAPRDKTGLPPTSWLDRGLNLPPDQLVAVNADGSSFPSVPWQRVRRIAGPEAWQIHVNTRVAISLVPPSWVLDTAYMSMSVKVDSWHLLPQLPQQPQWLSLSAYKEMLPIRRFPIFTSSLSRVQIADKLGTMWHKSYSSMSEGLALSKHHNLKPEERHRRRSPRSKIGSLNNDDQQKTQHEIYGEILHDTGYHRWTVPSGWHDDEAVPRFWEKCKAEFENVMGEKAESREMEFSRSAAVCIPGLN